jgi:molecular chaperone DnaJ
MTTTTCYYELLQVDKGSSPAEIKRAYRKLAMIYHPDRNKEPEAIQRFQRISEAYQILADDETRNLYDQYGAEGIRTEQWDDPQELFRQVFGEEGVFEQFFGGRIKKNTSPEKGDDINCTVEIELEETLSGCHRESAIVRLLHCPECDGSGQTDKSQTTKCTVCSGNGHVAAGIGMKLTHDCPNCGGHGQIISNPCGECRGSGYAYQESKLKLLIPPGVENGSRLRNVGGGDCSTTGGRPGNLYINIKVKPHPFYTQKGRDLYGEVYLPLSLVLDGGQLALPTLTGDTTILTVPRGTQGGEYLEIRQQGTRSLVDESRGSIFIKTNIKIPTNITARDLQQLKNILERYETINGA